MLGPPVAGLVTETLSWHWVFLGLVPLVVVALALVAPAVRNLGPAAERQAARRGTAAAAVGAAVGVAALSWAGQHPDVVGAVVAVVAVLVLAPVAAGAAAARACSARGAGSRRSWRRAGCSRARSSPSTPTCR